TQSRAGFPCARPGQLSDLVGPQHGGGKDTKMRRLFTSLTLAASMLGASVGCSLAAGNPSGTGQPNQTCGSSVATFEPGHASSAPGSAFNENGGIAGSMYAGQQPQNSKNPKSVSQYDVACFHVTQQVP
ncbi:hypothetical protein WDZ92_50485, partial [Nostoc sp. NIES-2111]